VSVICPTNADFPTRFEVIDDIAIYRHFLPLEGRGALAYLREYSTALFHEFRLLFKVHRERGFSIIQACNPPDLIFLGALTPSRRPPLRPTCCTTAWCKRLPCRSGCSGSY
jgi:hypothetical protein